MRHSLLALTLIVPLVLAGEITFQVSLDQDDFSTDRYESYDVVILEGGSGAFPDGLPDLPAHGYAWVIPQGTTVTGASVEIIEETELGSFRVNPVRTTILGALPDPFVHDESVYLSEQVFPVDPVTEITNGNCTGFRIASATFVPFRYHPLSGRLSLITEASVTLTYEEDPTVRQLRLSDRQISTAMSGLENIVRNPQDLTARAPMSSGDGKGPVWVAVGAPTMETTLQPLVNHRQSTTGSAAFVSLDWIYANYTGWDEQEQIRNYLKDAFENDGLIYALIVGDYGETTRVSTPLLTSTTATSTGHGTETETISTVRTPTASTTIRTSTWAASPAT